MSSDPNYKYTTPTGSILYSEVLSPYVYAKVVELYPMWLHPNLVTLCGFISVVLTNVLVGLFSSEFTGTCGKLGYLAMGFLFAGYVIFDNTDGKQARRTKTSSNAGEVFDHGVDMTVATLSMIMVSDAMALGYEMTMLSIFCSQLATYMNNWYHKVTGVMSWGGRYLSVDEATLASVITCFGAGIFGSDLYQYEIYETSLPLLDLVGAKTITLGILIVFLTASYALFDFVVKVFTITLFSIKNGVLVSTYMALLPYVIYVGLFAASVDGCVARSAPFAYALATGLTYSIFGTRLIFTMKFKSGIDAVIQDVSTLSALAIYSCLGKFSVLGLLGAPMDSSKCDPGIALRAVYILLAINTLSFIAGLTKVSAGQPLFTIEKSTKSE